MAAKVVWSERALEDLRNIVQYLEQRWTEQEKFKFATQLEKKIGLIQNNPLTFKLSYRFEGTRECLIRKNLSVFYIVLEETVFIITLWDNRRNPTKIRSG